MPPELGYPENDFNKSGPRPTTFSVFVVFAVYIAYILCKFSSSALHECVPQGQRALDFVLKNQGLIDKTLLFDIELLKVIAA